MFFNFIYKSARKGTSNVSHSVISCVGTYNIKSSPPVPWMLKCMDMPCTLKCIKRTWNRQGRHRTPVRRRVKATRGGAGSEARGGGGRNALRLRTIPSPITSMSSCIACRCSKAFHASAFISFDSFRL